VLRIPNAKPIEARCDMRLPTAALSFRMKNDPQLTGSKYLNAINITAWLYRDDRTSWKGQGGRPARNAAEILKSAYGL
jgi:hypothetical protein